MTSWADRVTRDTIETVEALKDALFTMNIIMADPLVTAQRGYAYCDDDTDVLEAGRKALALWTPNPQGIVQRQTNALLLEQGGRAVELAGSMLRREGFYYVMSAGDMTLEGDAWHEGQKLVVENARKRYEAITQYQRN